MRFNGWFEFEFIEVDGSTRWIRVPANDRYAFMTPEHLTHGDGSKWTGKRRTMVTEWLVGPQGPANPQTSAASESRGGGRCASAVGFG